jgi:excisionase family DNA binding protein
MTEPILLTPAEAARALGIGRSKLYELLQTGVLESVHIGACRRIPADALTDLVKRLREGADLQSSRLDRPHPPGLRMSGRSQAN